MITQDKESEITFLLFKIQIVKHQTKFKAVIYGPDGGIITTEAGKELLLSKKYETDLYSKKFLIETKLPDLFAILLSHFLPKNLRKKDFVYSSQNFCSYVEFKDRSEKFVMGLGYVDDTQTLTPHDVLTIKEKILLPYFEKKK